SHGVDSVGLAPVAQWRQLLGRAGKHGTFVGVDEEAYPRDFAVFVRYYFDLLQKIPSRYPPPPPLTLTQLAEFLAHTQGRYQVQWHTDSVRKEGCGGVCGRGWRRAFGTGGRRCRCGARARRGCTLAA